MPLMSKDLELEGPSRLKMKLLLRGSFLSSETRKLSSLLSTTPDTETFQAGACLFGIDSELPMAQQGLP